MNDLEKNNQRDNFLFQIGTGKPFSLKTIDLLKMLVRDTKILANYSKKEALERCNLVLEAFIRLRDEIEKKEEVN